MINKIHFNLYIGNHGKPEGIDDYIILINKILNSRGFSVQQSSSLDPAAVNIIIDEFTNYIENYRLVEFKRNYPKSKVIFVLTEFVERRLGVESFNHFDGLNKSTVIALFDLYLRMIRDDFEPLGLTQYLTLFCYVPMLGLHMMSNTAQSIARRLTGRRWVNPFRRYAETNRHIIYMHMRYLGLKSLLRHADGIITSHEKIIEGFGALDDSSGQLSPHFGVLYPEFDEKVTLSELLVGKILKIEITGSITNYRQNWISRINSHIIALGIHHVFDLCEALSFNDKNSKKLKDRGAYSLHPPQTKTWPYCSPTRIFRALTQDHNLPVLTKHFQQHPIEDICVVFEGNRTLIDLTEMYENPIHLHEFIGPKMRAYNKIATSRNDALIEKLLAALDESPQVNLTLDNLNFKR